MDDYMDIKYAVIFAMFLMPFVSANALLVTVAYNSGTYSIKHVEMVAGQPGTYSLDGDIAIAYENATELKMATSFNMPLVELGSNVTAVENPEITLSIPVEPNADTLALYNYSGSRLAEFSLSGISNVGDAKGVPPADAATNGNSITQAVNTIVQGGEQVANETQIQAAIANEEENGTTTRTGTTSTTNTTPAKGGACLIAYGLPVLGAAAWYRKKK